MVESRCGGRLCGPLPVTGPLATNTAAHQSSANSSSLIAVIDAAMIFTPSGLTGISCDILARDMVVGADFHPAKATEIAFGLVGANALVHKPDAVIDAVRIPTGV